MTLCLIAAGCGEESPEKHIAKAKSFLDQQNAKAAVIELKNALQQAPSSGEARFLLGKALLERGEVAAAIVELRKAGELDAADTQVIPLQARAMVQAGQGKQLIEEFGATTLDDAVAMADLKTSLASAQAGVGDFQLAQRELDAALKLAPDFAPGRLLQARTTAGAGDTGTALRIVDEVLQKSPNEAAAWVLKGELLEFTKADPQTALDAYRKALAVRPDFSAAHAAIISILLEKKQSDAVAAQLAELKKFWPGTLQVRWFEAQLAYLKRDFKEAGKLAEQLVSIAPDNVRFLHFSASVALMNGSALQAENSLSKALTLAPENPNVRRLLGRAQLKLGQPAKALAAVQPMLDKTPQDAEALVIAAQALLLTGESDKAQDYFARAAKLNPADTASRTAVAVGKLSKGDANLALGELRDIAASDSGTTADLQLINALVRRRDYDGAIVAIDGLEKKQATSPLAAQLRGNVLLAKKDRAGARASFERAVAIDPKYFLSVASLASLDLADKKPELARQRLERLLALDPKNMPATMALIDVRAASGATRDEVTVMLNDAIKADPAAPAPRLKLIEQDLRGNDKKSALAAAQAAAAAVPNNAQVLDALAQAQLISGAADQAIASYGKIAALLPQSPAPHLRIADIQASAKNSDAARQSLRRALALDPGSLAARHRLIDLELGAGNTKEALEQAQAVQKLLPQESIGHLFEGDVQATQKNWPAAIAAFRRAYAVAPSAQAAIKLHAALSHAGQSAAADAFATQRLKAAPDDVVFMSHLGELALARKDFAGAEQRFADIVRLQPDAVPALNNLAWVMVELKKKGALPYAEKANALNPNQAPLVDTLARVLAFEGQADKAVALQKQLVESRPDDTGLRLNLAKLYVQTGNKAQAKAELERLSALGDKVADQAEVGRLLKTL